MSSNRELAAWHEAGHASAIKEVSALNGAVEIGDHGSGLTFGNGWGDGDRVWETLNGDPLDRWIRKTERLIRGTKREIEVLAEALYKHGRVDGDDARAILSGRY